MGSDDGVKAWVNGRPVLERNELRSFAPGQDRVTVHLLAGQNDLELKVTQAGGDWQAAARLVPLGTGRLRGLQEPPPGETAWSGRIADGDLTADAAAGHLHLTRSDPASPSLGAPPPPGAVVLLPYRPGTPPSLEAWQNPAWEAMPDGSVLVHGGDNRTRASFGSVRLHVEFLIPSMPAERGQGRGNSGVYLQDRYEIQVLDSFGLDSQPNDCGALYDLKAPDVNACRPPLEWQTYDVVFRAAKFDRAGKRVAQPRLERVEQNGVVIHAGVGIPHSTGGAAGETDVPRAPLRLQDHGNPVRFRNVWLVELKD